ncbi:carboxylesterase family protein [Sphingobium sp. AP49]|uniref:carboxylesterase/lipase family protein n=1 Tax=Sphingobium sp. AP49 TaxID=1144307 RepID=UPI00026ECF3A|nr:carboxylesterase family protein [Sphingobium sp. AP49]WHO40458.1 carboxylesterase family protein [Sphingobium sp. AP49]
MGARIIAGMTGLAALAAAGLQAASSPSAPTVMTGSGPVRGLALDNGAVFKGIPFAQDTGGAHRWTPPRPVTPWTQPRDATAFGPICPQPAREGRTDVPQSEDCLSLNIATPNLQPGKRPVLLLVHGGAFFVGSGAELFDDAARIYNPRGILVVSLNYRLGRLGFFSHPGLRAGQPGVATGNYWLMDQIAGLNWVHANIARFGGDPAQVTIMGCSAGGSSINALMAAPAARGLFARASAHSGGGLNNATRPRDQAEREGVAFAVRAGSPGEGADAIIRLRALDPAAVMAADPGPPNFGAVVDGQTITQETAIAFARGDIARVPYIAGSTSNEASVFGLMGFDEKILRERFGIDLAAVRNIYDPAGTMPAAELLRQVQTDFIFTAAASATAALAARHQPAWSYHFAYVPPAERATMPGAPHCADFGYTLGAAKASDNPENAGIARQMQDYWTNFITTGNPNGAGLPAWPRYQGAHRAPLLIDRTIAAAPDFRAAQLRYWQQQWADRTGQARP